jgi:hypothetical protein
LIKDKIQWHLKPLSFEHSLCDVAFHLAAAEEGGPEPEIELGITERNVNGFESILNQTFNCSNCS